MSWRGDDLFLPALLIDAEIRPVFMHFFFVSIYGTKLAARAGASKKRPNWAISLFYCYTHRRPSKAPRKNEFISATRSLASFHYRASFSSRQEKHRQRTL
jgi:hypothetical protein